MLKKLSILLQLVVFSFLSGAAQNLVPNGGFEDDFDGWTNLAGAGSSATFSLSADAVEGTKSMQVEVSAAGPDPWTVQSINSSWAAVNGTNYTLSFYAKASANGARIRAVQQQTTYSQKEFLLTTSWQKYEWNFTTQEDTLQLKFHYPEAGVFLIDDIVIPEPVILPPNLLQNGDFENNLANWWTQAADGGVATFSIETSAYFGAKALKAEVVTPGANAWSVQAVNDPWPSVAGKEYTLSFYARSAAAGSVFRVVLQNTTYASRNFTLTENWQKYEWTFTAAESALQLKFHFPSAGVFYIDHCIIPPPETIEVPNLVSNGSFENDFSYWFTQVSSGAVAAFSIETVNVFHGVKAMKVDVTTTGPNAWNIQAINDPWPSIAGKQYNLVFYAMSTTIGGQFKAVMQKSTYAEKTFTLTTAWQKYEWSFIAQEDSLQLKFHFPSAGVFFIDHIVVPPPVDTTPNLVVNGGFENDFTGWFTQVSTGAVASFLVETAQVIEGAKAMKVDVATPGPNAWNVQTINDAWPSLAGETYLLTFYAKTSTPGAWFKAVQQRNTYSENIVTPALEWQKYTWQFTAQEDFLQLKFHFPEAGIFYIDNIVIQPPVVEETTDELYLDPSTRFQTMEGFGGSMAFYDNWIYAHPNKELIYEALFDDLGLDILRLKNDFRYEPSFMPFSIEFAHKAAEYSESSARILLSSWSPPASLKSANSLNNGTLKRENSDFVYGAFGDYWRDALEAYANLGVYPEWISIQNEPDYGTDSWESCRFAPTETTEYPGYDRALDSVYQRIKNLPRLPKMIGAEELGIGYNNFDNYSQPIRNKEHLFAYAYHLYHGGISPSYPDSYNDALRNIRDNFGERPNFMTEYERFEEGWLKTAWLVSNTVTEANAAAYLYWNLVWPDEGLIDMDYPWDQTRWEDSLGFRRNPHFYAFKHFSKHVKPGFRRVSAENIHRYVRTSAFLSPDERNLVVVLINTSSVNIDAAISLPGDWILRETSVTQSVEGDYYRNLGQPDSATVELPANSITTLVMDVVGPDAVVAGLTYSLFAKHSGNALSVKHCSLKEGFDIVQSEYMNRDCQSWKLEDVGNGAFRLIAVHSSKSLSVSKGSLKDGVKIEQSTYTGGRPPGMAFGGSRGWVFQNYGFA